jgi:hypothetical protein
MSLMLLRRGLVVVGLCLMAAGTAPPIRAGQARSIGSLPSEIGSPDETLRLLFTPASFPAGTFSVYRSGAPIRRLAGLLKALDPRPAEGAWRVENAGVFDAFGAEGPYDKPRLALLFGGASPSVARGSLVTATGRVALTLISPVPNPSLDSLREGTMVIVAKLPR